MLRRTAIALGSALALALLATPAAFANTVDSSNWSGYAVHRSGLRFGSVSAQWTQPSASCVRGESTYSAAWVGIGGYSASSNALEQIGTELDCTASGRAVSSAWYELVPAPSRTIGLQVSPGETVRASVTVRGHTVTVAMADISTGKSFTRRLHANSVDTSSAEWIVEAPSSCSGSSCQTLPLADFGSVTFTGASAKAAHHRGGITYPRWSTTRIDLVPHGRQFVGFGGGSSDGEAIAGSVVNRNSFTVTYQSVTVQGRRYASTRQTGVLVHLRQK